jgi:hypothetical protein
MADRLPNGLKSVESKMKGCFGVGVIISPVEYLCEPRFLLEITGKIDRIARNKSKVIKN